MAIVKMVGKVGGNAIIFSRDGSGFWMAAVPKDINGEFIVEVIAFDEAGNEAYSSSMLFIVDASALSVKIIPLQFAYKVLDSEYKEKLSLSDFVFYSSNSDFKFKKMPAKFTARVVSNRVV